MVAERPTSERLPNKERRWESPSLKEIKEKRNNFKDNQTEAINLFRLLLSKKTKDKSPDFSFFDTKDIFQSTQLSDKHLIDLKDPYEFFVEQKELLKHLKPTREEQERNNKASEKWRSLPSSDKSRDAEGYFQGPRVHTSGAGTFFTNKYRAPGKPPMKLEGTDYRINLALTQEISAPRVLMDLYEILLQNQILAEKGFQMKTLANNRTDSIIIYCGEHGAVPIITEVGNYCLKENLGDVAGVPFGATPLIKDGRPLPGLRVTSDPDLRKNPNDYYTYNDLQVTTLSKAFETTTRDFLQFIGSPHTFEDANQDDLQLIHKHLAKKDEDLIKIIEEGYASELEKICGKGADLHNLAFPVIK